MQKPKKATIGQARTVSDEILHTTGCAADFILNTSGRPESLLNRAPALAPRGRFGFVAFGPGSEANLHASVFAVGKPLQGISQGGAVPQSFIPELIKPYRTGRFPFHRLVRLCDFHEIEQAFEAADTASPSNQSCAFRVPDDSQCG